MLNQELYNIQPESLKLDNSTEDTLKRLRQKVLSKLPLYKVLSPPKITYDAFNEVARKIQDNFTDVIVVSMGGANLNPAMLLSALANFTNGIKLHFISSTNPLTVQSHLNSLNLNKTAILTISKSGNTLETLAILATIINIFDHNGIDFHDRYFFITNQNDCKLLRVAQDVKGTIIEHDQGIGGRYSGLSAVALVPAMIAGINVNDYIHGANIQLESFLNNDNAAPIQSGLAMYNSAKNIHINVIYDHRLSCFADWKSQIIAESLGKNGLGYTPVKSIGPEDQHSMYQLYLDGPDDKFYSYISIDNTDAEDANINYSVDTNINGLDHIKGMTLSEIHKINEDASFEALMKVSRPLRKLTIDSISAKNMGALVAFSMIEIIFLGELMGVNPFNQDGVELIKQEARKKVG